MKIKLRIPNKKEIEKSVLSAEHFCGAGHWMIDLAWLRSLRGAHVKPLQNFIVKMTTQLVQEKMTGEIISMNQGAAERLRSLVPSAEEMITQYEEFSLKKANLSAVFSPAGTRIDKIDVTVNEKTSFRINADYFALLSLDSRMTLYSHKTSFDCQPIVGMRDGKVVMLLMGIR